MDFDSTQILELTAQGISYLDDEGNQKFLDFAECANTYLKWMLAMPTITERQAEWYRIWKYVGEINFVWTEDDDLPDSEDNDLSDSGNEDNTRLSVTFHDQRVTSFSFARQQDCFAFCDRIYAFGWSLHDSTD